MSKPLQKTDPRIASFCRLINDGIEAWVKAGELLCEICKDDPLAFDKINAAQPHLTHDILVSFERIGRREIYPYLLVDGSPGARLLCGLPYDRQVAVYRSTVLVATKTKFGFGQERKRVCDLTTTEAARVFNVSEIRPVSEQIKLFSTARKVHVISNKSAPESETDASPTGDIDEDPKAEVRRHLNTANDEIVEARSVLTMLNMMDDAQLDQLITKSLNAVGQLRYLVNEIMRWRKAGGAVSP